MGIAAGTLVESKKLEDFKAKEYLTNLMKKKFNGYLCVTIKGKNGLEEGMIIFERGKISSGSYEYFYYNRKYKAEQGFERTLNAMNASIGLFDLFSLTPQQVKLVQTLKEDEALKTPVTTEKLKIKKSFSYDYESSLSKEPIKGDGEITRDDLLEKYGLGRLREPETTKEMLMHKARKEAEDLEKAKSK